MVCKNCGFKVKNGEWYATPYLHLYCATSKDLRLLRERGKSVFEEGQKNPKKGGMGTHFGTKYDGFCLEM